MASRIGTDIQAVIIGIIAAVIFVIVGIALGPEITGAMADINATSMANVTMGSVIVLVAGYVPFFYYLGVVLGALAMVWAVVKVKT